MIQHKFAALMMFTVALLAAAVFWISGPYVGYRSSATSQLSEKLATFVNREGKKWGPLPQGVQTYQIAQAAEKWPKIIQATIDPLDVHVGNTQKMTVIVESREPIVSVEANIETDSTTVVLPLKAEGVPQSSEVLPSKYFVDGGGRLNIIGSDNGKVASRGGSFAATVSAADSQTVKYYGEWLVRDTHDTFYHTTFVVKDTAGNENSITLAWSDLCGIPMGGNWTMGTNCTIPLNYVDGVDNGNVTLLAGTLTLDGTFVFNPTMTITLSGGSIAVNHTTGGGMRNTYLWIFGTDADGDGYITSNGSGQMAQDTQPAGYVRRYTKTGVNDCYDSGTRAASVHPGQTVYSTSSYGGGAVTVINPASFSNYGWYGDGTRAYCPAGTVVCGTNGGSYTNLQLTCCALTAGGQAYTSGSYGDGTTYEIDSPDSGASLYCGGRDILVGAQWAKSGQIDRGRCAVPSGLAMGTTRLIGLGQKCLADEFAHGAINASGKNDAWGGVYCTKVISISYDYNCNGYEDELYPDYYNCDESTCSIINPGWESVWPLCGETKPWVNNCFGMPFSCNIPTVSRQQSCR